MEANVPTTISPKKAQHVQSRKVFATGDKSAVAAAKVEPARPLFDPPVQR
jgi:hypothetical protein